MEIVLTEFPKRYGGNIRVFLSAKHGGSAARDRLAKLDAEESEFGAGLDRLAIQVAIWQKNKLSQIESEVRQHGPLSAKAFPGRASILVKILKLSSDHISAAYEKPSSGKIGNYIPGMRMPIR